MAITITARNYRILRETNWTPGPLSLVVGPNGAGKSTLLSLLELLRLAYQRGGNSALSLLGGAWGLRSFQSPDQSVGVGVVVDDLAWELEIPVRGAAVGEIWGETVRRGNIPVLRRAPLSDTVEYRGKTLPGDERCGLRIAYEAERPAELAPLIQTVERFRVYHSYNLSGLRSNGSRAGSDWSLSPSGENVFSVLRNWRDKREFRKRYEFVVAGLRGAFPELFADLGFDVAGLTVSGEMILAGQQTGVPAYFAPNGWLTALLHLTAVAGTEAGGVVAIDEFENTLHPFAIRKLIEAIARWGEEHDLAVCLASHSPVVVDEFKDAPEHVFVMQYGAERLPQPLTELRDPEWLAHFALGDLYAQGEFGGQTFVASPAD